MTRPGTSAGRAARAGIAAVAIVALALPAHADPTRLVTEPAGWRRDPEQATALAQRFAAAGHLGARASVIAAEAYVADKPGVALFVTRATATLPAGSGAAARAARAARAALDELRASSARATLTGGAAQERGWQERVEADARQVTATLSWADARSHAVEAARVVVARDGTRIVAVTGECIASDAADAALIAACQVALATLDPGVAASSRVALTLAAEVAGDAPEGEGERDGRDEIAAAAAAGRPDPSSPPAREPARLGDGSKFTVAPLPPMTIPLARPEPDRRPMLVGAGVIVLALVFWWNRRQRDRFEDEERGPRVPRRRVRPADEDADDLHAAARGEDPEANDPPEADDPPEAHDRPATPATQDRQDP
jgi:hypothetical protein